MQEEKLTYEEAITRLENLTAQKGKGGNYHRSDGRQTPASSELDETMPGATL